MVFSDTISLSTKGFSDIQDITSPVAATVGKSKIRNGTVPVIDGKLALGTWQQIVFIDFDNRGRRRNIVAQVEGEAPPAPLPHP